MTRGDRLKTIEGHLRAVRRLLAEGRTLEAAAQLQAAQGAVRRLSIVVCKEHALRCLGADAAPAAVAELVAVISDAFAEQRRETRRGGSRWRKLGRAATLEDGEGACGGGMAKILVVDDEETMTRSLATLLKAEGYDVVTAGDGPHALAAAREQRPDLIVLDVMLPELDGMEVCRQIRTRSAVPIIMLTAKTGEIDTVVGLEVGADDYVTKPFSPRELVARVKAQLRRAQMQLDQAEADTLEAGEVAMDIDRRHVTVGGREVALAPKEFDLLRVLLSHPGRVLGRDFLLNAVWGQDFFGDTRTLDVHIRWLREKIEDDPGRPRRIQTVHGVGYRLTA